MTGLVNAVAISAGSNHACALLGNGTAKCWGADDNGQLGMGDTVVAQPHGDAAARRRAGWRQEIELRLPVLVGLGQAHSCRQRHRGFRAGPGRRTLTTTGLRGGTARAAGRPADGVDLLAPVVRDDVLGREVVLHVH